MNPREPAGDELTAEERDVEALAREMFTAWAGPWWDDASTTEYWRDVFRSRARVVLTSDWLAARLAARGAEDERLRAQVAAVRAVLDEHTRMCNPAPYTSERALAERLRAALGDNPDTPQEGR